jgi:hypothetical protein
MTQEEMDKWLEIEDAMGGYSRAAFSEGSLQYEYEITHKDREDHIKYIEDLIWYVQNYKKFMGKKLKEKIMEFKLST